MKRYLLPKKSSQSFFQYFQRLIVLDEQIKHLDEQSMASLGEWLARKWNDCQTKMRECKDELSRIKIDSKVLHNEWDKQVAAQTKPMPSKLNV